MNTGYAEYADYKETQERQDNKGAEAFPTQSRNKALEDPEAHRERQDNKVRED